jgi:carbonic anhydrase/acetyltransferase-like protein (isoleucine patch superfamily)
VRDDPEIARMERSGMIYEYKGNRPKLGKNVFIAPTAVVLGDVEIGDASNVWFHTVIRGDVNAVRIGAHTNIQDHCMLHVTGERWPLFIGDRVIVGHCATLHGCVVEDDALIGVAAVVLDGAVVHEGAIVGAGALVPPGAVIPPNAVAMGAPATVRRFCTAEEKAYHQTNLAKYEAYARHFFDWAREVAAAPEPREGL